MNFLISLVITWKLGKVFCGCKTWPLETEGQKILSSTWYYKCMMKIKAAAKIANMEVSQ